MNYHDSLRYLNSFLNLERITFEPRNRLWNLKRMRLLLQWFRHPQKSFFSVLIAGTKGKGSTGFFLESILSRAKILTGFYSSPHLEDPRERIRVGAKVISKSEWTGALSRIQRVLQGRTRPQGVGDFTYFEILTLLAALTFQKAAVRIAIFEVGMGGRLDATRLMGPKMVLLTPIHLDHEAILGNTIAKIAREKVAIVDRPMNVVTSPQRPEAQREIDARIKQTGASLWRATPVTHFRLGLSGDFQRVNAGVALKAAERLRTAYPYDISHTAIKRGLEAKNWPGRFELLRGRPHFLLDGAHNPVSADALVKNLERLFPRRKRLLIFATSRDKKSESMLKILSAYFSDIVLTVTPNPRAQEIHILLAQARRFFTTIFPTASVREALGLTYRLAHPRTLVVVTGSFYLIGEARKILTK